MKPTQLLEKPTTAIEPVQNGARLVDSLGSTSYSPCSLLPQHKGKTISRNTKYMLIGVIASVLVVGTVILSIYFGIGMAKDNYKEYQAIYVDYYGDEVHESVIVTETEEIFCNDAATGIADFSTGIITIHITSLELYADQCFVTNLDNSDFQTPKEFIRRHTDSQITFKTKDTVQRIYDITDIWLNNNALGTRSAKLCKDKVAFFLRVKQEFTTKVKRAVKANMVPFPKLHFFMPGFAPLTSRTTTPQS